MRLLDRVRDAVSAPATMGEMSLASSRVAIIDIGSNSVRLVVYQGPRRSPFVLFNEKVLAGLGAELEATGRIGAEAIERGLAALARFRHLCDDMQVRDIRCVATAAVRDAENGPEFVAEVRALGLEVRILSGLEEARASAHGVLAGLPGADGVMGDLGGGSLELARISQGQVVQAVSLPMGVLRIRKLRARGKSALAKRLDTLLSAAGWTEVPPDLPFYMVGGSWRAVARIDMLALDYPVPIFHNYPMDRSRLPTLAKLIAASDRARLKGVSSLSGARIPTLPDALALLSELTERLNSGPLIVSAHGLREGLLYEDLPPAVAAEDPLLSAARAEGNAQGRFAGHGDLVERWIAPAFATDTAALSRIRHAACLLADVGWRASPDFRAERGLETGLHGNWAAISMEERALLAQALYTSLGGSDIGSPILSRIADTQALRRATHWGLAIRLAQRLSGGVARPLQNSSIALVGNELRLTLAPEDRCLLGEAAERRVKQLATAMGLEWRAP